MSAYYIGRERVALDLPGSTGLGAGTGVWRIRFGGEGVPERILTPATPTSNDAFWSDPNHWRSHPFVTPDGATLGFPPPPDNFGALVNWRTGELVPLGMEEASPGPCQG